MHVLDDSGASMRVDPAGFAHEERENVPRNGGASAPHEEQGGDVKDGEGTLQLSLARRAGGSHAPAANTYDFSEMA